MLVYKVYDSKSQKYVGSGFSRRTKFGKVWPSIGHIRNAVAQLLPFGTMSLSRNAYTVVEEYELMLVRSIPMTQFVVELHNAREKRKERELQYREQIRARNGKKSVLQWCAELDIEILDADGFRDLRDWDKMYFTKDEFMSRIMDCTIKGKVSNIMKKG